MGYRVAPPLLRRGVVRTDRRRVMRRVPSTFLFFIALSFALGSPVLAQPGQAPKRVARSTAGAAEAGEPAGYREAVAQAVTEYQLLNWDEARALFARAH